MGFEWSEWALDALRGITPQEVVEALGADRRLPRSAVSDGVHVLVIWARTAAGRPLLVAVRSVADWHWLIIGARELTPAEVEELESWEASTDA
jgi:hypothetical protein